MTPGATAGTQAGVSVVLARAKALLLPAAGAVDRSPGHLTEILLLLGTLGVVALVFLFDDERHGDQTG